MKLLRSQLLLSFWLSFKWSLQSEDSTHLLFGISRHCIPYHIFIEPILDACLCDIAQTEAPPTIVDWQKSFSTDCTGVLPQTRPEWAVISSFNAGADVDKNDS